MNACGLKAIELKVPSTEHLSMNELIEKVDPDPYSLAKAIDNNIKNSNKLERKIFKSNLIVGRLSLKSILYHKRKCL